MRSSTLIPTVLATATTLFGARASAAYTLKDDLSYKNFFNNFEFYSGPDPTNGFVQYQTLENATANQLVGYYEDRKSVYLGVDFQNKDPKGRASVRLEGKKTYNLGLMIADIYHMPDSVCGSWPAMWLLGVGPDGKSEWPNAGELDILEGVNDYNANAVTLHTSAGCAVENGTKGAQGRADSSSAFLGTMTTDNCDVQAADQDKNVGCSIKAPKPDSAKGLPTYGTDFNNAGGGVYATEWTSEGMSVWFFPRNSSTYLSTFASNASSSNSTGLDPSTWGTPLAKFQGSGCDFSKRFQDLKMIFNVAFCGDWAGKIWDDTCKASTGAATCQEYVQNNPDKFSDSYWEIGALKWYENGNANTKRAVVKRAVGHRHVNVRHRGRRSEW